MVPKLAVPAVPAIAWPEASVARYRFLPMLCNPAGLTKRASWIVPTSRGTVSPACSTLTVPSMPTETEMASVGIVMAGSSRNPSGLTTRPSLSSLNEPARV